MSVPTLSILFMALAALFAFAVPIVLLIYYKRKGAEILPFFIGCAVFVLFALILEALMHQLVLKVLPVGEKIMGNTLLYALYGGLAAGVFEETGRYLAFRTVLKKRLGNDRNALMYGAGHGGIEAILLLGFAYISNIVMSVLINAGQTDLLTATAATGRWAARIAMIPSRAACRRIAAGNSQPLPGFFTEKKTSTDRQMWVVMATARSTTAKR